MTGKIIALSAWRQSGKDTVAAHLVSQYKFTQLSFAAKLKDAVASAYKIARGDLDLPTRKEIPILTLPVIPSDPFTQMIHHLLRDELSSGYWTPRALCILEGSIKRAVNSNYWTRSVIEEILNNPGNNYVISDLRYKSEADTLEMFLDTKLQIWRINRHESISTQDPSERDMDDYTKFAHTIYNTQDIRSLYNTVDAILLDKSR